MLTLLEESKAEVMDERTVSTAINGGHIPPRYASCDIPADTVAMLIYTVPSPPLTPPTPQPPFSSRFSHSDSTRDGPFVPRHVQ